MIRIFLFIVISVFYSISVFAVDINFENNAIVGYWEVQKVIVDKKEDSGESGQIWIFRKDGTFKFIKLGIDRIYPEGFWKTYSKDSIQFDFKEKNIEKVQKNNGQWSVSNDSLTIKITENKEKIQIFLLKLNLKVEPTKPRY